MEVSVITIREELDAYISCYTGMKQRDDNWYKTMGVTVGSSELSAIMGTNPYSKIMTIIRKKVDMLNGINTWTGSPACWWGILFEDVIAEYVSVDLSTKVVGDSICIVNGGFRNSPDGFAIIEDHHELFGSSRKVNVALLEFKCPIRRVITNSIPKQYIPQVLSGLCASPIATVGLFVDASFRRCSIDDLGDNCNYDTTYGREIDDVQSTFAWGIILVFYSSDEKSSSAAMRLKDYYLSAEDEAIDFGIVYSKDFDDMLGRIDCGDFLVKRMPPCLSGNRGSNTSALINSITSESMDGCTLLGYIPWKLLDVRYIPIDRQPDYMDKLIPLIDEVNKTAYDAVQSGNADKFLMEYEKNKCTSKRGKRTSPASKTSLASPLDDLYS